MAAKTLQNYNTNSLFVNTLFLTTMLICLMRQQPAHGETDHWQHENGIIHEYNTAVPAQTVSGVKAKAVAKTGTPVLYKKAYKIYVPYDHTVKIKSKRPYYKNSRAAYLKRYWGSRWKKPHKKNYYRHWKSYPGLYVKGKKMIYH